MREELEEESLLESNATPVSGLDLYRCLCHRLCKPNNDRQKGGIWQSWVPPVQGHAVMGYDGTMVVSLLPSALSDTVCGSMITNWSLVVPSEPPQTG